MLSPEVLLSFFIILALSSLAVFVARRVKLPHTVFLVIVGAGLGFLSFHPAFEFIRHFEFTPELLFFLLLPTLIFESAFAMQVRHIIADIPIIFLLAVVGLLVSALAIAVGLSFGLGLIGLSVPFILLFLFGTIISATDPVAVLALFKEYGAPERLSLIFEGESLFNDATAVALFFVVLAVIADGFNGSATILMGILQFSFMIVSGVLFGAVVGNIFSKLVGIARESEVASITLTIVLAHLTFILAEIISHDLYIFGTKFAISSIIATTIASLIMGNYGRAKIHPSADVFVSKLWSQLAFMANSVIFVLIGLLFVRSDVFNNGMLVPILITIVVVAIARAISIYPITFTYNLFAKSTRDIPLSWSHLLSWGSLRGALAITMVLLVPDDTMIDGWTLALSPKEFLLSLTAGCIFATLFVKATTMKGLMQKLKLYEHSPVEATQMEEARALINERVLDRLNMHHARGYIPTESFEKLSKEHGAAFERACGAIKKSGAESEVQARSVARMYAIGIELIHLKELYEFNEVSEEVYRRIHGKLLAQFDAIEHGHLSPEDVMHTSGRDFFERLAVKIKSFVVRETPEEKAEENYLYYRAQSIISRKVLKELGARDISHSMGIFSKAAFEEIIKLYETYKEQSRAKMLKIAEEYPSVIAPLSNMLALRGVYKSASQTLEELRDARLITNNLYIALRDELREVE